MWLSDIIKTSARFKSIFVITIVFLTGCACFWIFKDSKDVNYAILIAIAGLFCIGTGILFAVFSFTSSMFEEKYKRILGDYRSLIGVFKSERRDYEKFHGESSTTKSSKQVDIGEGKDAYTVKSSPETTTDE